MGVFYLGLYTMSVGIGGLKSGSLGYGSDQFDEKDKKGKAQGAYFNRFGPLHRLWNFDRSHSPRLHTRRCGSKRCAQNMIH